MASRKVLDFLRERDAIAALSEVLNNGMLMRSCFASDCVYVDAVEAEVEV